MEFNTQIVHNIRYRKYRTIRGILFILFLVVGLPAYYMNKPTEGERGLLYELERNPGLIYYYITLATIAILYGFTHYFTWRIKKVGSLKISEELIEIEDLDFKLSIKLNSLKKLLLERGSTYHKDEDFAKPYKGDNFIEVHLKDGGVYKFEFAINSEEHNEVFEKLVKYLTGKLGLRFKYISI